MVTKLRGRERAFALLISGVHGMDHFLKRLFPPLIPIWGLAFGYPLWKLGLLMGVRSFGSAIGQAPIGELSDRHDRRLILPAGIAVIGLGIVALALLSGLGSGTAVLEFGGARFDDRFLLMAGAMLAVGVGSSTVHPTGYPLISANVAEERKGTVLGMWGSASKFGEGLAPAMVGGLLLVLAWNHLLVLFGVVGVAYALVLFASLGPYETRPVGRRDSGERSGREDTSSERTRSFRSLWRADRRRYAYPLVVVAVYFTVQIMAATGVTVFLPEFLTSSYGYAFSVLGVELTPESTASFYYAALLMVAGVGQLGTGRLVDRHDSRKVLIAYLAVSAAVLGVLAVGSFSPLALFGVLLLLGASLYGMNPARDSLVGDIAPPELEGRAFGYIWTAALLASSVAPTVVGYLGDRIGLRAVFLVIAGVLLASAVPILLLLSPRVYRGEAAAGATGGD